MGTRGGVTRLENGVLETLGWIELFESCPGYSYARKHVARINRKKRQI